MLWGVLLDIAIWSVYPGVADAGRRVDRHRRGAVPRAARAAAGGRCGCGALGFCAPRRCWGRRSARAVDPVVLPELGKADTRSGRTTGSTACVTAPERVFGHARKRRTVQRRHGTQTAAVAAFLVRSGPGRATQHRGWQFPIRYSLGSIVVGRACAPPARRALGDPDRVHLGEAIEMNTSIRAIIALAGCAMTFSAGAADPGNHEGATKSDVARATAPAVLAVRRAQLIRRESSGATPTCTRRSRSTPAR